MMAAFGTADVALLADDALEAAQILARSGIAILGGDVFYQTSNGLHLAYANWSTKPEPGEDPATFVTRSIQETCEYIRRYPSEQGRKELFALVIGESTSR